MCIHVHRLRFWGSQSKIIIFKVLRDGSLFISKGERIRRQGFHKSPAGFRWRRITPRRPKGTWENIDLQSKPSGRKSTTEAGNNLQADKRLQTEVLQFVFFLKYLKHHSPQLVGHPPPPWINYNTLKIHAYTDRKIIIIQFEFILLI